MVAVPMVVTVAMRSPATIDGTASGISTCQRIWRGVIPIARADSRTAGSTPRMPVTVLRRIGNRAYRLSARMAVCSPMPVNGNRKPNSARLGTVCAIFVKPNTQRRVAGRRATRTAAGSASVTAMAIVSPTSRTCCSESDTISRTRLPLNSASHFLPARRGMPAPRACGRSGIPPA